MAAHKYICTKTALVLPRENGGTITLSEGQVVVGPHYAKFVGYGLVPYAEPRPVAPPPPPTPKPQPPKPVVPVSAPTPVVAKPIPNPPPKPTPAPEPKPAAVPPPEPKKAEAGVLASALVEEDTDSLPKDLAQLKAMKKGELADMAKELGLDNAGSKDALVKRIAEELGLS